MRFKAGRIKSMDQVLNRFQDALIEKDLLPYSIPDGRFLETLSEGVKTKTISLTTTAQIFEHKLGRQIQGYFVAFQDAAQTIYGNITNDPTNSLTLQATGNVNARIWVF